MKLFLTLLLLSIFAVSKCDYKGLVYCTEMCPYFKKMHPNKEISYEEVKKECKKGIKEIKKSCAALKKLHKKVVIREKKVFEKLTWTQACSQFCQL